MSDKEKFIEEALQENAALRERIGILGECLHLQSENLRELENIKPRLEKLEHFFSGKVKNPIYEAIEAHIEGFNERIVKIEEKKEAKFCYESFAFAFNDTASKIDARIKTLEEIMTGQLDPTAFVILKEKITALETEINTVRALGSRAYHPRKPHKCPVCEGSQRDYFDMLLACSQYPDNTKLDHEGRRYQECRACEGKGILWG